MNERRPIVLALLGGIAAIMLGYFGYQQLIVRPIATKESDRRRAEDAAQKSLDALNEAKMAALELDELSKRLLPGDSRLAVEKYQGFLVELLKNAGISNPTITPGPSRRPSKNGDLHVLPVGVDAETDIWSLTRFLMGFYQSPLIHQITNLSLTPVERKDIGPALRVSLTIEAVGRGEARGFVRAGELVFDAPVDGDREAYGLLVEKNPLYATGPGSTTLRANDPEHVVLTSIWHQGAIVEADLFDRAQNSARRVRVGEECTVGRVRAVIVDMGLRDVVVAIDGNLYLWEIGTTFNTRKLLSADEALDREVRNRRRLQNMN